MKKNVVLCLLVSTFAMSAFAKASTPLLEAVKKNPLQSPYQILEEAFNKASDLISFADIPTADQLKKNPAHLTTLAHNISVDDTLESLQTADYGTLISTSFIKKGEHSIGPLISGIADVLTPVVFTCKLDGEANQSSTIYNCQDANDINVYFNIEYIGWSWSSTISNRQLVIYADYKDSGNHDMRRSTYLRKSGDLILTRTDIQRDGEIELTYYNYAWPSK